MFPGGKEVLLEALHVRSLDEFFSTLLDRADGAKSLEDLLMRCIVSATTELRNDQHLAMMLATDQPLTQSLGIGQSVNVAYSDANNINLPIYGRVQLPGNQPGGTYSDVLQVQLSW